LNPRFIASLSFIEDNLDKDLSIDDVAAAACLSRYHYSRLFRVLTNETVMGYIRRRRLSVAAESLIRTTTPIIDIALASGFDSNEAFTRAFRKMFAMTPSDFRQSQKPVWSNYRRPLDHAMLTHLHEGMTMEPVFKTFPTFNVVGLMDRYTPETNVNIPKLWQAFLPVIDTIPGRVGEHSFGVCVPTDRPEFDYYAAVEVQNLDQVPDGMHGCHIEAAEYAVFTHMGSLDNLRDTVGYIWGTWLPTSSWVTQMKPDFEFYTERFNPESPDSELDIYIPVEKA
jgi:AraC family transcriptional regulator